MTRIGGACMPYLNRGRFNENRINSPEATNVNSNNNSGNTTIVNFNSGNGSGNVSQNKNSALNGILGIGMALISGIAGMLGNGGQSQYLNQDQNLLDFLC